VPKGRPRHQDRRKFVVAIAGSKRAWWRIKRPCVAIVHSWADRVCRDRDVEPRPAVRLRRRRFQRRSLQKRKSGGCWTWIAFWREAGRRRGQILASCSTMSRPERRPRSTHRCYWKPSPGSGICEEEDCCRTPVGDCRRPANRYPSLRACSEKHRFHNCRLRAPAQRIGRQSMRTRRHGLNERLISFMSDDGCAFGYRCSDSAGVVKMVMRVIGECRSSS